MTDKQRAYLRSHPHLTFETDLRYAPWQLWVLLGEAQAKCRQIAGIPLPPGPAQELHKTYLAKGALATTAIEGNTLTEEEVARRIAGDLTLPPSREYLGVEVDNVVRALNAVLADIHTAGFERLTAADITAFNRGVLAGLELDPGVRPGEIPPHGVAVAGYSGAPREDCEYLLERLCSWLNQPEFLPEGEHRILFGIIRAVLAHLYLVWIHPFGDGNGRTARLMEFRILLAAGVPSPAAQLLSSHYNKTRTQYYRELSKSSRKGVGPLPFLHYAVRGFVDGLQEQIDTIRAFQWAVLWRDYVSSRFSGHQPPAQARRRDLVLELGRLKQPFGVERGEIPQLTPCIATAYARVGPKTLARDLAAMCAEGLLVRSGNLYAPNRELLDAFVPAQRAVDPPERPKR